MHIYTSSKGEERKEGLDESDSFDIITEESDISTLPLFTVNEMTDFILHLSSIGGRM